MKKIIITLMMMLFVTVTSIANEMETIKYVKPIKIENIDEAFVNIPANVIWHKVTETDSAEFINIRSNDKYLLNHLTYNIEGNKIVFGTDIHLNEQYDITMESPINICIYSKNNVKIKTNKRSLLILEKNNRVLTDEK